MGKRKPKAHTFLSTALTVLAAAALVTSCGGSGGGGGTARTPAALTAASSGAAASAAAQSLSLLDPAMSSGGLVAASASPKAPMNAVIDRMMAFSRTLPAGPSAQGNISQGPLDCSGGGTITLNTSWTGPDQPPSIQDMVDLQMTITADNCVEYPNTMNGTLSIAFSGTIDAPAGFTFSAPGSRFADSTYPFDITMSGFSMAVTDLAADGGTATFNGTVSGTVDMEGIDQRFQDFRIVQSEAGGISSYDLSGGMWASCLGGWATVSTPTPVSGPSAGACPTAGQIDITSGDDAVSAVINSDSSIDVHFNDAPVHTYIDCNALTGVCAAL